MAMSMSSVQPLLVVSEQLDTDDQRITPSLFLSLFSSNQRSEFSSRAILLGSHSRWQLHSHSILS